MTDCTLSGDYPGGCKSVQPSTGYDWIDKYFRLFTNEKAGMAVTTQAHVSQSESFGIFESGIVSWTISLTLNFNTSHDTVTIYDYPILVKNTYESDLELHREEIQEALESAYTSMVAMRKEEREEIEECKRTPHCYPEDLKCGGDGIYIIKGKDFRFRLKK